MKVDLERFGPDVQRRFEIFMAIAEYDAGIPLVGAIKDLQGAMDIMTQTIATLRGEKESLEKEPRRLNSIITAIEGLHIEFKGYEAAYGKSKLSELTNVTNSNSHPQQRSLEWKKLYSLFPQVDLRKNLPNMKDLWAIHNLKNRLKQGLRPLCEYLVDKSIILCLVCGHIVVTLAVGGNFVKIHSCVLG